MLDLAIIGAGQLGSRHLQALARLARPTRIVVIDPSASSLATARERWDQVAAGADRFEVRFETQLAALPEHLDVAIVATNADIRPDIVITILGSSRIEHLILEKVLAQSQAGLDRMTDALNRSTTKAWVNCPRRLWSFYAGLKQRVGDSRLLQVNVSGSDWGLGCNAVHFLDLTAWLSGTADVIMSGASIDSSLLPSKRAGFFEVTGTLSGVWAGGAAMQIASWRTAPAPFLLDIRSDDLIAFIREDEGLAWIAERSENWQWREHHVAQEFQSALTDRIVTELTETGSCGITPFAESARLHGSLLAALLPAIRRVPEFAAASSCPIT